MDNMNEKPTFFDPATGSIDKPRTREFTFDQLAKASATTWGRLSSLAGSDTLKHALGYKTPEQTEQFTQNLERIQLIGQTHANEWNRDNYLDSSVFETRIVEKAQEYTEGHENDPIDNYWKALGNRHDQALAVASFQKDFSDKVDALKEITDEDKNKAAYYLAENIRKYGSDLVSADSREKLIASGKMSKEDVEAALKSGLVQYADVEPQFNQEQFKNGFENDEAWNEAVYKTAAGVLEDRLVKQITELAQVDEAAEILKKAQEIFNLRTQENTHQTAENHEAAPTPISDSLVDLFQTLPIINSITSRNRALDIIRRNIQNSPS